MKPLLWLSLLTLFAGCTSAEDLSYQTRGQPLGSLVIDAPVEGQQLNESLPLIAGTTDANVALQVEVAGQQMTVVSDDDGRFFLFPKFRLSDGPHQLVVESAQEGAFGQETVDFVVRTAPPSLFLSFPTNNQLIAGPRPTLEGRTDPDQAVRVHFDDGTIADLVADQNGDFSLTPDFDLDERAWRVVATAETTSGSTARVERRFFVRNLGPEVTILTPRDGETIADVGTISGRALPNSRVSLRIDSVEVGQLSTDGLGVWSYTPASALDDGERLIEAFAIDELNLEGPTASSLVTIQSDLPDISILSPFQGSWTRQGSVSLQGSGPPSQGVNIFLQDVLQTTVEVNPNGEWNFLLNNLTQSNYDVRVEATNAQGTTIRRLQFRVDQTSPAINLGSPSQDAWVNTPWPVVTGTTDPDILLSFSWDQGSGGQVRSNTDGAFRWDPPFSIPPGPRTLTVIATDRAGNTSQVQRALRVQPVPPQLLIFQPSDATVTNDAFQRLEGITVAEAPVDIYLNDILVSSQTSDGNGGFVYVPDELSAGEYAFRVKVEDLAGNLSVATSRFIVEPRSPTLYITDPANFSTTDSRPVIAGVSQPGQQVDVFIDGVAKGSSTAEEVGNFGLELTNEQRLGPGTRLLFAEAIGADGSTSTDRTRFEVLPSFVLIEEPRDGDITAQTRPTFSGTAPARSDVVLRLNGERIADVTANDFGFWNYQVLEELADGTYQLEAQVDATVAGPITFFIDTSLPDLHIDEPLDQAMVPPAFRILGRSSPGNRVDIFLDGGQIGFATTSANQIWVFHIQGPLPRGPYEIEARVTNIAGSTARQSISVFVEDQGPSLQVLSPEDADVVVPRAEIRGIASPGALVDFYVNDNLLSSVTTSPQGEFVYRIPTSQQLPVGVHRILVVATNQVGFTTASPEITVSVDPLPTVQPRPVPRYRNPNQGRSVEGGCATQMPTQTLPVLLILMGLGAIGRRRRG